MHRSALLAAMATVAAVLAGCGAESQAGAPATVTAPAPGVEPSSSSTSSGGGDAATAVDCDPTSDLSQAEWVEQCSDETTSSEADGPYEKLQPINGGTYTWASGITMTTKVEVTEDRGGEADDLCGDGSCGVLMPEDTTVTVRYDVTIPDEYPDTFDPSTCSLSANIANGNDEDAITSLLGDYNKSLDGVMLPGTSKYGVDEFVVDAEYAGDDFILISSCGDTEYLGDTALFYGILG